MRSFVLLWVVLLAIILAIGAIVNGQSIITDHIGVQGDSALEIGVSGEPGGSPFAQSHDGHYTAARQYNNQIECTGTYDGTGQYHATYSEWAEHDILEIDMIILFDTSHSVTNFVDSLRTSNRNGDIIVLAHDLAFVAYGTTQYDYTWRPFVQDRYAEVYKKADKSWIALEADDDTAAIKYGGGDGYFLNPLIAGARTHYVKYMRDVWNGAFCTDCDLAGFGVIFDVWNGNTCHAVNDVDLDDDGVSIGADEGEQKALVAARNLFLAELADTMRTYWPNFIIGVNGTSPYRVSSMLENVNVLQIESFHRYDGIFTTDNYQCYYSHNPYYNFFNYAFRDSCKPVDNTWRGGDNSESPSIEDQDQFIWTYLTNMSSSPILPIIMIESDSIPQVVEALAMVVDPRGSGPGGYIAPYYMRDWRYYPDFISKDVNASYRWFTWSEDAANNLIHPPLADPALMGAPTDTIRRERMGTHFIREYTSGGIDLKLNVDHRLGMEHQDWFIEETGRGPFSYCATAGSTPRFIEMRDTIQVAITADATNYDVADSMAWYGGRFHKIVTAADQTYRGYWSEVDTDLNLYNISVDRTFIRDELFGNGSNVEGAVVYFGTDSVPNFVGSNVLRATYCWRPNATTAGLSSSDTMFFVGMTKTDLNLFAGGNSPCDAEYMIEATSTYWPSRGGAETSITEYDDLGDITLTPARYTSEGVPGDGFVNFISGRTITAATWERTDVTPFYQQIANGGANNGIALVGIDAGSSVVLPCAHTHATTANRPVLELLYEVVYYVALDGDTVIRTSDIHAPEFTSVSVTSSYADDEQYIAVTADEAVRWSFAISIAGAAFSSFSAYTDSFTYSYMRTFGESQGSGEAVSIKVRAKDRSGNEITRQYSETPIAITYIFSNSTTAVSRVSYDRDITAGMEDAVLSAANPTTVWTNTNYVRFYHNTTGWPIADNSPEESIAILYFNCADSLAGKVITDATLGFIPSQDIVLGATDTLYVMGADFRFADDWVSADDASFRHYDETNDYLWWESINMIPGPSRVCRNYSIYTNTTLNADTVYEIDVDNIVDSWSDGNPEAGFWFVLIKTGSSSYYDIYTHTNITTGYRPYLDVEVEY